MQLLEWRVTKVKLILKPLSYSLLKISRFWKIIIIEKLLRLKINNLNLKKDKMQRTRKFWNIWNSHFELNLSGFKFQLQKILFLVWMQRAYIHTKNIYCPRSRSLKQSWLKNNSILQLGWWIFRLQCKRKLMIC